MGQSQTSFIQQLKVLWQYKWWIIAVAFIAGFTSFMLIFMQPTKYLATTTIMLEDSEQTLTAIPSDISGSLELIYLEDIENQIQVLRSHSVLENAVIQIDPDIENNNDILQSKIIELNDSLSIKQVSKNIVELIVSSSSPDLAQQQADAIAQAYIDQLGKLKTSSIQNALEGVTNRLAELQNAEVDLSISPVFLRLNSQLEIAYNELQNVSEILTNSSSTTTNIDENLSTSVTPSKLAELIDRIDSNLQEATNIGTLAEELDSVSESTSFSVRSSNIAIIESETRALSTKLNNLSAEIKATRSAEINLETRNQFATLEDYMQIAASTNEAILSQITVLFSVQENYIAAKSSGSDTTQSIEADANALNRIRRNQSFLIATLNSSSDLIQGITSNPINSFDQSYSILKNRMMTTTTTLQELLTILEPDESDNILLSYIELSKMDLQIQNISIGLSFISSDLARVESEAPDSYKAKILDMQESVRIATNSIDGLGDEITDLINNAGDISYISLDTLRQELQLALISSDVSTSHILDTAVSVSSGSFFSRYRSVLLATIAGFLVSVVVILLLNYFNRTVRDGTVTQDYLNIPLLAEIELKKGGFSQISSSLDEVSPFYLESFRLLRTNLNLDLFHGKTLIITSPQVQEGKTTIATNLARIIALQGRKVLLIDANLRNPDIAKVFGLDNEKGLSDLLAFGTEESVFITEHEGIDILPGGSPTKISAELLSSPRLKVFLEKAKKQYDVIIIDSAPTNDWTDTRIMSRNVDAAILVLKSNTTNLDAAKESKLALESVGARVEGFVLTNYSNA